jgi:hypothetical protein
MKKINDINKIGVSTSPVERGVLRPEPYKEIIEPSELETGRYYHCISKDHDQHSIHKVYFHGEHRYLGFDKIWATETNPQAFERWKIYGPIERP